MENNQSKLFKDDVKEVIPDLFSKPSLCITCRNDRQSGEEDMFRILNRIDQQEMQEFKCYAYEPKDIHKED